MSKQKREIGLIVAVSGNDGGISKNGKLPWGWIKSDLQRFKRITENSAVIMGKNTWQSLPTKPLPNRLNIIITSKKVESINENIIYVNSIQEAFEKSLLYNKVYFIGGESIYHACLPLCNTVHYTIIKPTGPIEFDLLKNCDRFFAFHSKNEFYLKDTEKDIVHNYDVTYYKYERIENKEEKQYLRLIESILLDGNLKGDRTGVGTLSLFGTSLRFNLEHGVIPLLTSKKTFWKGIVEELLWMISGNTSAKTLQQKGIKIWDGNSSREFLDKMGFTDREEGDLGPVYGFQWRHFGAKYGTCNDDYTGKGIDQLQDVIDKIKNNPNDRRIVMSAWNPTDLNEMVLPPCHMFAQFYVAHGKVSCQMYQRSADIGLGVPFNIASYALLTHIIAHCCSLKAGEFIHVMGDTHIYNNHINALKLQLQNKMTIFPKVILNEYCRNIDDLTSEDIMLYDYFPVGKSIAMEMAI